MSNGKLALTVSDDDEDVAYLSFPGHPGRGKPGVTVRQVKLQDLMKYTGPDVFLDFDKNGCLIGLEILV
jgi:uncharacterized protein YuzE